jgi:ABC-type transport system involved in multi-copper enzyme maturation permease subunit
VRLGTGPVFAYEWLTATRRWQLYALRSGFVGVILVGMMVVWHNYSNFASPGQTVSLQQLASYGETLYITVVSIELTLVLLAAPAVTAGAVCLDKARGTLDHLLATDLSNAEIVLGKLGTRLVPALGLIACVVPITALASLLGGIDPHALLGSFLTAIACTLLGCSLALTLSVWGRKTHEVLMLTYLILILWLSVPVLIAIAVDSLKSLFSLRSLPLPAFAKSLWEWIECSNPYFLAIAPYTFPGQVGWATYLGFLAICLGVSALLVGLATLRIRELASTQAEQLAAKARRRRFALRLPRPAWLPQLPGPSLDGNPVLWREWHRSQPSGLLRVVWLAYTAVGFLWIALSLVVLARPGDESVIGSMSMFQVTLGLLLLSVSAATSLAEERVRGSLDVLLATPLSTRSILIGKWLGTFRLSARVLVWPAIMAGLLVAGSGRWIHYLLLPGLILAYSAGISSLGLALATWVSRLGRAVALCVSAYVGFSIGWMVFVTLVSQPSPVGWTMMTGSPFYGTYLATNAVAPHGSALPAEYPDVISASLWISIHGGIATLLFAATLATFDRCLGRVSKAAGHPIPNPRKMPVAKFDPDYGPSFPESKQYELGSRP